MAARQFPELKVVGSSPMFIVFGGVLRTFEPLRGPGLPRLGSKPDSLGWPRLAESPQQEKDCHGL